MALVGELAGAVVALSSSLIHVLQFFGLLGILYASGDNTVPR